MISPLLAMTMDVLSFADGHAELWKWVEPRTIQISQMKGWIQGQLGVAGKDRDLSRIYDAIPIIDTLITG